MAEVRQERQRGHEEEAQGGHEREPGNRPELGPAEDVVERRDDERPGDDARHVRVEDDHEAPHDVHVVREEEAATLRDHHFTSFVKPM
jgi:hypothetical protein